MPKTLVSVMESYNLVLIVRVLNQYVIFKWKDSSTTGTNLHAKLENHNSLQLKDQNVNTLCMI